MATTAPARTATIKIGKAHHNDDGLVATLTPVRDDVQGVTVHLVEIDEYTARYYGAVDLDGTPLADRVIGGIVRDSRGWGAVAYFDRDEFLTDPRAFHEFIPVSASSRAHAVRMLIRFYFARQYNARYRYGAEVRELTKREYRLA